MSKIFTKFIINLLLLLISTTLMNFYKPLSVSATNTTIYTNTFTVTNTEDGGEGSLRWAIESANNTLEGDNIYFDISGEGPFSIKLNSVLPQLNKNINIDGSTQPGFDNQNNSPIIEISGENLQDYYNIMGLRLSNNITVSNIAVNHFKDANIFFDVSSNNNILDALYINLALDGVTYKGAVSQGGYAPVYIKGNSNIIKNSFIAAPNNGPQDGLVINDNYSYYCPFGYDSADCKSGEDNIIVNNNFALAKDKISKIGGKSSIGINTGAKNNIIKNNFFGSAPNNIGDVENNIFTDNEYLRGFESITPDKEISINDDETIHLSWGLKDSENVESVKILYNYYTELAILTSADNFYDMAPNVFIPVSYKTNNQYHNNNLSIRIEYTDGEYDSRLINLNISSVSPYVKIISPQNNQSYYEGETFKIQAEAIDDQSVTQVEFYKGDGVLIGDGVLSENNLYEIDVVVEDTAYYARAYDAEGRNSDSFKINITSINNNESGILNLNNDVNYEKGGFYPMVYVCKPDKTYTGFKTDSRIFTHNPDNDTSISQKTPNLIVGLPAGSYTYEVFVSEELDDTINVGNFENDICNETLPSVKSGNFVIIEGQTTDVLVDGFLGYDNNFQGYRYSSKIVENNIINDNGKTGLNIANIHKNWSGDPGLSYSPTPSLCINNVETQVTGGGDNRDGYSYYNLAQGEYSLALSNYSGCNSNYSSHLGTFSIVDGEITQLAYLNTLNQPGIVNMYDHDPSNDILADFDYYKTDLNVSFNQRSAGNNIVSYAWDFNNDSVIDSNEYSPDYIFSQSGTYKVKLIITNSKGNTAEIIKDVIVSVSTPRCHTPSEADWYYPEYNVCNGDFETNLNDWKISGNENVVFYDEDRGNVLSLNQDDKNSDIYQHIPTISIANNKTYTLSVDCKAGVGSECGIFLGDANNNNGPAYENQTSLFKPGTGDWQTLYKTISLTKDENLDAYLYAKKGNVLYDNIKITTSSIGQDFYSQQGQKILNYNLQNYDFGWKMDKADIVKSQFKYPKYQYGYDSYTGTYKDVCVSNCYKNYNPDADSIEIRPLGKASQKITEMLQVGKTYLVKTTCKAQIGDNCKVFFGDTDNYENVVYKKSEGTGQWQTITMTKTLTKDEVMSLYVYGGENNNIFYKDLTVVELNCSSLICNGDFTDYYVKGIDFGWKKSGDAYITYNNAVTPANSYIYNNIESKLISGKTYEVTAECLANTDAKCSVFFGDVDNYENTVYKSVSGTGDWQTIKITKTLTKDELMSVYLYGKLKGANYRNILVKEVVK